MSRNRLVALTGAVALAVPSVVLAGSLASPAAASYDREGRCSTGSFDFSVDKERRGFDVDLDLENLAPNSSWTIRISQDGKNYLTQTRTTDYEGELDVDTFRPDSRGKDVFTFTATRSGGSERCSASVTRR